MKKVVIIVSIFVFSTASTFAQDTTHHKITHKMHSTHTGEEMKEGEPAKMEKRKI